MPGLLPHLRILPVAAALALAAFTPQSLHAQGAPAATLVKDPIPGPKTCFWARGPHSKDPYINVAYPDGATFYWAAIFSIPEGAKLTLEGEFPHARYMSFISYNEAGVPVEAVADYLIKPQAGSSNPFLTGADRNAAARSYSIEIVDGQPDPKRKEGMNITGETRDRLHTPKYGPGQQAIIYRIYANDLGRDEGGGVPLPTPVLTLKDGKVLRGAETCTPLRARQAPVIDAAALAVPFDKYAELVKTEHASDTHPATSPPTWFIQYDREYLYGMYTGKLPANPRKSEGGFYPNPDNQYIRTILNRRLGKVFVMRGKAPTTPKTLRGDAKTGTGELRYWSFCSNQGFANTRVNDCVHDEQIPTGPDGFYTIVVSRKADRPRNAIPECGIAWLPMADDGDGAFDEDVTVLQLRHMLGTESFPNAIQAIDKIGEEAKVMGPYFPRGRYATPSSVETLFPCLLEKRQ